MYKMRSILRVNILLICLVASVGLAKSDGGSPAEQRVVHSHWGPRTIDLKADDITTIMALRSELSGNLTHVPRPDVKPNQAASVFGFQSKDDVMTWSVRAQDAGDYEIAVLYHGRNDILSKCQFTIAVNSVEHVSEYTRPRQWESKPFFTRHRIAKTLHLKKGVSRISLYLTQMPEEQIEAGRQAVRIGGEAELQNGKWILGRKYKGDGFSVWSIEMVRPEVHEEIRKRAKAVRASADWMIEGKYGLFAQWGPLTYPLYGDALARENYEWGVDVFDVNAFADMVEETGAAWVTFGTSHGAFYYPAPVKAIDKVLPGRTTKRDLIGELADELGKRNIKLMLYFSFAYSETYDKQWPGAVGIYEETPQKWFDNMEAIYREISLRYGKRLASPAAYIDGCGFTMYQYDYPWEKLARAIKAGNSDALIGFSPCWGPNVTHFSDLALTDGHDRFVGPDPEYLYEKDGQLEGVQQARWFFMDAWHPQNGPYNGKIGGGPRHPADDYIKYFKKMAAAKIPLTINLLMTQDVTKDKPFVNPECLGVMRQIRKAIRDQEGCGK
jgi:hypothetical protein